MPEDISAELLFAYVVGSASRGGIARVEAWIAADPDNARLILALREALHDQADSDTAADEEYVWRRVCEAIAAQPVPRRPLRLVPHRLPNRAVRIAAALVLATAATLGAYWVRGRAPAASIALDREIVTAERELRRVNLPDGSIALLAPASRLRYPATLGTGTFRHVYLSGRAYFQVAHDVRRPFIVHARQVDTRVLGTQFVVGAYDADTAVQIVVQSGRVAVSVRRGAPPSAILERGDRVDVQPNGVATLQQRTDLGPALGWTEGRLEFADAPLPEVFDEFRRWYGMSVDVADPALLRQRITGSYEVQKPEQALRLLAAALDADIVRWAGGLRLVPSRN